MLHSTICPAAEAISCKDGADSPAADGSRIVAVDDAWSGASARFDTVARNDIYYVSYYDKDRWLSVAQIDPKTGRVCKIRLENRFAGWDAHNYVKLAFDQRGVLHVAGNMHSTPLIYGHADAPDSLQGLRLRTMTGQQEQHVTYPTFLSTPDRLVFIYRDGVSGDGSWLADEYRGGSWSRIGNKPVFVDSWKEQPISAYPTSPELGPDGIVRFAIVWRKNPDVDSNVAISFVSTRDFITFQDAHGHQFRAPIGPDTSDMIDEPGIGGGLLNNPRMSLDPVGQPVVVYHRYAQDGRNEIIAARPKGASWLKSVISTSKVGLIYKGRGSMPDFPIFSDVKFAAGKAFIVVKFPGEPRQSLTLDPATLQPNGTGTPPAAINISPAPVPVPKGLRAPNQIGVLSMCGNDAEQPASAVLSYVAQSPNGDRAPDCNANAEICNPLPTQLLLKIVPSKSGHICTFN